MWLVGFVLSFFLASVRPQHTQTVTIYPEYHSQNGRLTFDPDRWNGHHGLDNTNKIQASQKIGTRSGRWAKADAHGNVFMKAPEDPHRKGYSDPTYFKDHKVQEVLAGKYKQNIDGYGRNISTMIYTEGLWWPKYMGWSKYGGKLPDNLDAGVELIYQMMEGIQTYTGGILPTYYEPVNEPGGLYRYMDRSVWTDFYKRVARRLKAKWPHMRVGGPAYTGVIGVLHERDFRVWKMLEEFMNMSINHLDFFSYHAFNHYELAQDSSHKWGRFDEAKLVGIVDIVENYAHIKSAKTVPILITEWGLSSPEKWVQRQPRTTSEWVFGYGYNAQLFTHLTTRGFVDRGDAFLMTHPVIESSKYGRIFYENNTETGVAKAYRFWQYFKPGMKFLRVDSKYDRTIRMVTPLALADPHSQEMFVLLHNYAQSTSKVQLYFPNNWIGTTLKTSTCYRLDAHAEGFLHYGVLQIIGGIVSLPAEVSCFLTFATRHFNQLYGLKIIQETFHFGDRITIPIENQMAKVNINLNGKSGIVYCRLRLTITVNNSTASLTPAAVSLNAHALTSYFSRMKPSSIQTNTDFDVFEYDVPVTVIQDHVNAVKVHFHHNNGYLVSSVLVVGKTSEDPQIIG